MAASPPIPWNRRMVVVPSRTCVADILGVRRASSVAILQDALASRRISSAGCPRPQGPETNVSTAKPRNLGDMLQEFAQHRLVMQQELQKVIVGQDDVIEQIFAAIFTRGHCLLVGVPGLAKTLMVSTLAQNSRRAASSAFSSRPT